MPKSSFQELMELVTRNLELQEPAGLAAIEAQLLKMLAEHARDQDLIEAVLRRVRKKIRGEE
jgi:hypothetical protein